MAIKKKIEMLARQFLISLKIAWKLKAEFMWGEKEGTQERMSKAKSSEEGKEGKGRKGE